MKSASTRITRPVWAWAWYDWADSAFATTVMAGFFPVFFKQFWSSGLSSQESTYWLGLGNSLASLLVVAAAPLLGAMADRGGAKKRFLLLFTSLGVIMTGALWLVAQGAWPLALAFYVLGVIGFSGGNIFYDALLVDVAPPGKADWVSSFGYSVGYLGGGLLFAVNVLMVLHPDWFGLADSTEAVRWAFLSVALWWAGFAFPLFLLVRETEAREVGGWKETFRGGWGQLRRTFRQVRRLRFTFLFLLAYWLYIDGVDTVIRMAVDYGLALGFAASELMLALLITQFVGFPATLAFGSISQRIGPRRGILGAILIYILVLLWAYRMTLPWEFYGLAVTIGLVQGGIQALSRSLYTRLIPRDQAAEFFGFYNMLGKFAAVLGPFMIGWVSLGTGNQRLGIVSIVVLFAAGAILLMMIDFAEGERQARALEHPGTASAPAPSS